MSRPGLAAIVQVLAVTLLAWPAVGLARDIPSQLSVAPLLVHRFDAPQNTSGFGTSVGVGDFDGDGTPDLVIGGNPTFIYSGADHSLLLTIPGGAAGFGIELEVVGDVDGVTGPDLLIASTNQARVYSGATGIAVPFQSYVYDAGSDAGTSMAPMGDVDGDGRGDFVISELGFGNGGPRTTVYSSLGVAPLVRVNAGHSVIDLGDVNGDGIPDFATGRYGAIHVVSGAPGAKGETLFTVPGYDASLGAADVNGDGIKDLLLMMPQVTSFGAIGYVRAFSGTNGDTLGSAAVPAGTCTSGCFFRGLVCGIGDVDGDGHEEFAASIVWGYGGNYGPGTVSMFSGATLAQVVHLTGPSPGAALGYSLVGPGDVDGDDVPDLLVGAPGMTAPGRGPGAAFLYRLVHDVAAVEPPVPLLSSVRPNPARRGSAVVLRFGAVDRMESVDVLVLDVRGRVVQRLTAAPGQDLVWDGRGRGGRLVPAGMYLLRPTGDAESLKLVLLD